MNLIKQPIISYNQFHSSHKSFIDLVTGKVYTFVRTNKNKWCLQYVGIRKSKKQCFMLALISVKYEVPKPEYYHFYCPGIRAGIVGKTKNGLFEYEY